MSAWRLVRAYMRRLLGLFRGGSPQQSFMQEIESHLQMHIDDNLRLGMPAGEARRQALLQLGGVEWTKQRYRERFTSPALDHMFRDLSFTVRQLGRNLGFTVTAVVMLAVGMGASVSIFAFVDAALLKPLPYREPARLVSVTETVKLFGRANLSYPDYLDWKRMNHSLESLEIYGGGGGLLKTPTGAVPVSSLRVSDGFFRALGVAPLLGRDFYTGEDRAGAADSVILSYAGWQTWFHGQPDVVGQTITLNGTISTVIGILPQTFDFAPRGGTHFYVPYRPAGECDLRRSCHGLEGIARLREGVTVPEARAEMEGIAAQLERQYPGDNRGQGAAVDSLAELIVGDYRPILLTLFASAGLLLLIACVNVASLLLVRTESRRREIAVRGALGASRARIVYQFCTESLLLVFVGTVLGLAMAYGSMRLMTRLIPVFLRSRMPFLQGLTLNSHTLVFAATIALVAISVFAAVPLVRLPFGEMRDGLNDGGRGTGSRVWRRLGAKLVMVELAVAVVLLVGSGLLTKSFYRLLHVNLNFRAENLATLGIILPETAYPKDEHVATVQRQIIARVMALPGVQRAGLSSVPPVSFNGNTDWIRFVGRPYNGEHNEVNMRDVSTHYIETLQAPMLSGRTFTEHDNADSPKVAIINRALANMYYPGQDPIGQRFGNDDLNPKSIKQVVGVVDDIREASLDSAIWPAAYYPIEQDQDHYFTLVVRTSQSEASILPLLVSTVHSIDLDIGTSDPSTMQQRIEEGPTAYLHRSSAWLVGGFAALALLLSVTGIYGVIEYSVSQRTREIGVRMALGAQRGAVYGLVLREAAGMTVIGISAGLICSVAAATLMRKLLFGTAAWDAATLAAVALLLGISALIASYLPAHRAASIDPMQALRAD